MEYLKEFIVENGIVYQLGEDELYYPIIRPEQGTHYPIGKFGIIVAEYIMENQRHKYIHLFMDGKWNEQFFLPQALYFTFMNILIPLSIHK